MKALKDPKTIIMLALVLSSLVILSYPFLIKKSGAVVSSMHQSAMCNGIYQGSVIMQATGGDVRSVDDFQRIISIVKKGDYVTMVVDGGPGGCTALADGDVGLTVGSSKSATIRMSPDLQGSTKTTYSLSGNFTDKDVTIAANIIQQRTRSTNLQYSSAQAENGAIVVTTGVNDNTDNLVAPCYIDGKIVTTLSLQGGAGKLKIGNDTYDIQSYDKKLNISGTTYSEGQDVVLGGISMSFTNITNSSATETIHLMNNSDVISSASYGGVSRDSASRQYYFNVPMVPSERAVETLKTAAKGIGTTFAGGQLSLNGEIEYSLDGVLLSRLPMPYTLATQPIQSLSLIGIGNNEKTMNNLLTKTQMCLNSQPLKFALVKTGSSFIVPVYGSLIYYILAAALLLPVLSSLVMYVRIKSVNEFKLSVVSLQVPITLGAAVFTQLVMPIGWLVDIPTLAGVLSAVLLNIITLKPSMFVSKNKVLRNLDVIVFILGFIVLFTPYKGFGLALLSGVVLKVLLH